MRNVIRLEDVCVQYKDHCVLRDVSFEVASGEAVALIGPSGAGKSTLLGVLNGTVLPVRGEIWLLGKNIARLSSSERRSLCCQIGTVYQDFCVVESLRVIHNVNAGHLGRWSTLRALCSLLWPLDRSKALAALDRVGIPEKIFEKTGTLSGGQQQRVAIARVLVQDPAIILADEPISSLDPQRSKEVMNLFRDLSRDLQKTLITSCHSVEFAGSHFDRVIGIREGRLSFQCESSQLTPALLEQLYRTEPELVEPRAPHGVGTAGASR
jgi:phosphonate transport system ATP-binding protein